MRKPPRVLLDADTLAKRVRELGTHVSDDYRERRLTVVPVLTGSFVFAADLVRWLSVPVAVDFLGLRSYGNATETTGVVQITRDLTESIQGKDVLVVEDIVDTGLTMDYLLRNLKTRGPRSVRVAALLHKRSRERVSVTIDYLGFAIEDVFVVGYGMDCAGEFRNLPYVGVFAPETESE
ncbi:MAG: hypoxanthine phosphoribosyltransferase [Proteobacteria bacterium]|nr:hypoxanthine phosphoribosyltransferase [Pseudomonadota bacterium]